MVLKITANDNHNEQSTGQTEGIKRQHKTTENKTGQSNKGVGVSTRHTTTSFLECFVSLARLDGSTNKRSMLIVAADLAID